MISVIKDETNITDLSTWKQEVVKRAQGILGQVINLQQRVSVDYLMKRKPSTTTYLKQSQNERNVEHFQELKNESLIRLSCDLSRDYQDFQDE